MQPHLPSTTPKVQADFARSSARLPTMKSILLQQRRRANEVRHQAARKYSFDKYSKGRHKILTLVHSAEPSTLSATGQDVFPTISFRSWRLRLRFANDITDLEAKLDGTVCAVMLEYIQGEGGVNAPWSRHLWTPYLKCAARDISGHGGRGPQTGVGRTGTFLAGEQFGHKADVTTLAKGITGGLPMGACLANEKCAGVLDKGSRLGIRRQSGLLCPAVWQC